MYRPDDYVLGVQFANLYDSAHHLIDRFDIEPNVIDAWTKFQEETEELADALAVGNPHEIAAEACDVLVTLINVLRPAGVDENLLIYHMRETCSKNDRKSDATHVVRDGLIVRRDKLTTE